MIEKKQFIRDLKDKENVAAPFLIRASAIGTDKNGNSYMTLDLLDKTGEVQGRIWDDVARYASQAVGDTFAWIEGRCQSYQGRLQLVVKKIQVLREDEVILRDYVAEGTLDAEDLYAQLKASVESMRDPFYRALASSVLIEDEEIVQKLKKAPAAKSVHHAYKTGLLEHIVSITGLLNRIADHYGEMLDRDLLLIGGFFHDIGKLWELSYDRLVDYTTEGRLIGHHVIGVELVDKKIRELETTGSLPGPFPLDKKLLVKHTILAHHGKLEYGSPKRPKCLEALIVHYVDDLDSKINAIQRFIKADASPGNWTGLNRQFERYFYKGESSAQSEDPTGIF